MRDQDGFVAWFVGRPASGKSALCREVRRSLLERGIHTVILDSDELRAVLTPRPTYSSQERDWVYDVIVQLAAWLARSGVNVLIAATGHRRAYREQARARIPRFVEVHVRCPLEVCLARDPKGLYARYASGQVPDLPGLGVPFEAPEAPEVAVDTDRMSVEAAASSVTEHLGLALSLW